MAASGWCLSPGVTHTFLNTLKQKPPFFIPKCMRSFCAAEHNPFFIVLTSFKGMCLFLCDFPMLFAFMLLSSTVHGLTPTSNARNYSQKYFIEITLLRSFGRIIPVPFAYSLFSCSFPTSNFQLCLPSLETSTMKSNLKYKKRGTCASLLTFAASNLVKQSQEEPWVRPGLIQTPLCCVNAILGTGLYPTAAFYLGLTSHSKLYSSQLSLLSRENWLLSFN